MPSTGETTTDAAPQPVSPGRRAFLGGLGMGAGLLVTGLPRWLGARPYAGLDLALCAALASAMTGTPLRDDLVIMGEVGLGGEVRQVTHPGRRLAEAARLGFRWALVPANTSLPDTHGIQVLPVRSVHQALVHAEILDDVLTGRDLQIA